MKKLLAMLMAIILFAGIINTPEHTQAANPTMEGHGLMGEFFKMKPSGDRNDMSIYDFDESKFKGSKIVGNLNGDNSFLGIFNQLAGNSDYNTARFTGKIVPQYTEEYTFPMEGDDGFKLYVDGQLILDFWKLEYEKPQVSTPIFLEAGKQYDIVVEYLQGWGGAWLRMEWESASQSREVVPESALYPSLKPIIKNKKFDVAAEVQKVNYLTENFADKVTEDVLNNFKEILRDANELLATIDDKEVSEQEKVAELTAAVEPLSIARAEFMKEMGVQSSTVSEKFNNPLYQGQDPFVAYHEGFYYFVSSSNYDYENKIYVSKSRTLTDQGEKIMVFDSKDTQKRIFAPEIFFLQGKWYIYYCADVDTYGWQHMPAVLESVTVDPQGEYVFKGVLYGGENGNYKQANDFTVFEYNEQLYAIWGTLGAGEPIGPAIVKMDNPYTITNDRSFLNRIGGGEGPRVLQKDGKVFVTMSEGDYQSDGYRLSYFMNSDGDFLNEDSWTRKDNVFVSTGDVSGPARAGFVKSADGKEDWMIYHSRVYKGTERNSWRQVNIKKFDWNEDGTPNFGKPISPGQWQNYPSGDLGLGDMYQAENAILYGNITKGASAKGYQGTGYINLPNESGTEASFVVNAQEAGDYIVGVRYAYGVRVGGEYTEGSNVQLPGRAKVNVFVNGIHVKTIAPDKTEINWDEWFTGSERLALEEGKNVISYRIDNDSIGNVNFDYIAMYKADVPNSFEGETANLQNLEVSGNPANYTFASGVYTYNGVTVANEVASINVTATAVGVITIDGVEVVSGAASSAIELTEGIEKTIIIVVEESGKTKTYTIHVTRNTSSDSGSNNDGGHPIIDVYESTNGHLTLPAGQAGKVSLGEAIKISIPANAANNEMKVTIEKLQETVANQHFLASAIFKVSKNVAENLLKPVTMTFAFDPTIIEDNQRAAVFYYDEVKQEWVETSGKLTGNSITIETTQFAKYAVFAVDQAPDVTTAPEVNLSDIAGHWAEENIKKAIKHGIVVGYPNGTFNANAAVTRAEFVVMLINTLKLHEAGAELTFTDSSIIGQWAERAVAQATQAGFINGYADGSFRPNMAITRAEMASIVANALDLPAAAAEGGIGFADGQDIPSWAKGAAAQLKEQGLIEGQGNNKFVPNGKTTRAEAVTVLLKLLEK